MDRRKTQDRERLRKFLQQYQRAKRRKAILVRRWKRISDDMKDPLYSVDYAIDKTMGGERKDQAAALTESLTAIEEKITTQRDIVTDWLKVIEGVIAMLPEFSQEREILELRYIDGHSQQEVCDIIFRCRSSCGDIEAAALDRLMEIQEVRDAVDRFYTL